MNPSTAKARALVEEWVHGGVTDAVACPGSRNAPLLMALHDAGRRGRLRVHVRIDERCAGFLALGLALRSARVVPVVVTSGSAVANLHPAVLEASYSGVPLLVVSADRPLELVPTGANQTVDQVGLFGRALRACLVLGPDEQRGGAQALWRSLTARALDAAAGTTTGDPGPVQLDVPLREPLVPDDGGPIDGDGRAPATRVLPRTVEVAALAPAAGARTLVVAGQGGGVLPSGARLPTGVPVLAEPSSPVWGDGAGGCVLPAGPRVLAAVLDGVRPDLYPEQVVVLGRPTLHRAVARLLADPGVRVLAVPALAPDGRPRPGWADVVGAVRELGALPADPGSWAPDPTFAAAWAVASRDASDGTSLAPSASIGTSITGGGPVPGGPVPGGPVPRGPVTGGGPVGGGPVTGPALAAATLGALPSGALLVVGSSNPVRDVALHACPRADVRVLAARGTSGIDGAVSLATGAALAHDGPSYALLGDVTFLHDAGGLHLGADEPRPELTVVVADDRGGSIFALLEQGAPEHAEGFERMFATPPSADIATLCAAYGVRCRDVGDLADLPAALAPTGEPGLRVVRVPVDRLGRRAGAARSDAELRTRLAR